MLLEIQNFRGFNVLCGLNLGLKVMWIHFSVAYILVKEL